MFKVTITDCLFIRKDASLDAIRNRLWMGLFHNHAGQYSLLFLLLMFWGIKSGHAQKLLTTQFSNQEGSGGSKDYSTGWTMTNVAGTYRLIASADGAGDNYFRFRNTSSIDRRPDADGAVFPLTSTATPYSGNFFDGAFHAFKITGANTSYRYVFKVDAGVTKGCIFEIQGSNIRSVSSVSRSPSGTVFPGQTVTITATLDGSFHTGQAAYLRYTNDNFTTSTIVKMTGSGTTYTADIPGSANTASATVKYYVFTSGDISGTIAHGDADLYTINLNNNSGNNYSYTVASCWTTAADGNWSNAATWTAGVTPVSGQPICINHNVNLNTNYTASSITIAASKTLTVNSSQTLAIGGGITGSGALTVSGILQINAGGFTNIVPTYNDFSTLIYNSGNTYNASNEWATNATSGAGVPYHVQIGTSSVNNTVLSFGSSTQYRACRGNLTVGSSGSGYGLTLSSASGGDLKLLGHYSVQNATITNSGRAVFFIGNANPQTISTSATEVPFDYLIIDKSSGNVVLNNNISINATSGNVLQLLNGTLDLNGKTLTLNGNNGNIHVSGGARTITSGASGGEIKINGDKFVTTASSGTLTLSNNVKVSLHNADTGVDFGTGGLTTLNGVLELNTGTFVATNPPTYGTGSILRYNITTADYNRNVEWNSASLQNVEVLGSFALKLGHHPISELKMAGNLSISSGATVTMNALTIPLKVGGNIVNDGTLTLSSANGGDLEIKGNFTNNGTFNCNDREVRFVGTASQSINSTTDLVIDYFKINNAAGVVLNKKVIIDNELRLDNGIITTSATNPIEIRNGATSTSGSASSYVSGPMRKIGNNPSTFVFSIGKSSTWASLGIVDITGSSTTDVFTAEYFKTGAPSPTSLGAGLVRVSAIEYWTLDRTGTTNTAKVRLYWENNTASGINNPSSLRVCRYNGTQWVSEGQFAISYATSGYITSNTVTSFSPFSFGSTEANNNPLPITLLGFWGEAQPAYNLLSWQVADARYFSHFELQRYHEPSKTFATIAKIAHTGEESYQWQDYDFEELSYYRLKMVDIDSTENYSKTIAITRPAFAQSEKILPIAPNPIQSGEIHFVYLAGTSGYREFVVWDMLGKEIYRFGSQVSAGQNQLSTRAGLPAGVYLLMSLTNGQTEKFVVPR